MPRIAGAPRSAVRPSCSRCTRCPECFGGKFLDALRHAIQAGGLPLDPANTPALRQGRLKELLRHDWVAYAKTPLAGPDVVLDYLSCHTHRVAVSNERIVGIDAGQVRLRVRADERGGNTCSAGRVGFANCEQPD